MRLPSFSGFIKAKLIALGFLLLSLIGVSGKKNEKTKIAFIYFVTGIVLYMVSGAVIYFFKGDNKIMAATYLGITILGVIFIITGGGLISRIIKMKLGNDVFNKDNETFPQEERLLDNEYSINLPAHIDENVPRAVLD